MKDLPPFDPDQTATQPGLRVPVELRDAPDEDTDSPRPRRRGRYALVASVIAFSVAASALVLTDNDARIRVELTATDESAREIDRGPAGASVGDEFVLAQRLALPAEPGQVGVIEVSCRYLRVRKAGKGTTPTPPSVSVQCNGVADVGPDAVSFHGLNTFTPGAATQSRFVVTGGTGAYAAAVGEITATDVSLGTAMLVLDLRLSAD
ncbi:MAG: hypothetical protein ACT4P1_14330 [Sporichthyaceae bacterium]